MITPPDPENPPRRHALGVTTQVFELISSQSCSLPVFFASHFNPYGYSLRLTHVEQPGT